VAPPAAAFFLITAVPFSGLATRGLAYEETAGAVDVGAIGAEFLVVSVIVFPLAKGLVVINVAVLDCFYFKYHGRNVSVMGFNGGKAGYTD
jgi:hypothetical protein